MLLSPPHSRRAKVTRSRVSTDNKSIERAMWQPLFQRKTREITFFHGFPMNMAALNQQKFVHSFDAMTLQSGGKPGFIGGYVHKQHHVHVAVNIA